MNRLLTITSKITIFVAVSTNISSAMETPQQAYETALSQFDATACKYNEWQNKVRPYLETFRNTNCGSYSAKFRARDGELIEKERKTLSVEQSKPINLQRILGWCKYSVPLLSFLYFTISKRSLGISKALQPGVMAGVITFGHLRKL